VATVGFGSGAGLCAVRLGTGWVLVTRILSKDQQGWLLFARSCASPLGGSGINCMIQAPILYMVQALPRALQGMSTWRSILQFCDVWYPNSYGIVPTINSKIYTHSKVEEQRRKKHFQNRNLKLPTSASSVGSPFHQIRKGTSFQKPHRR
jgi:hypothetical protein